MSSDHISRILAALSEARVRYVVVGGVAVVLHGHLRFTADLDLVLALDRENVLAAVTALQGLGFRPRPPVRAEQFAEADIRTEWAREKGMTVPSLWSPALPGTDVDLFAEEPIPFGVLASRACPGGSPGLDRADRVDSRSDRPEAGGRAANGSRGHRRSRENRAILEA